MYLIIRCEHSSSSYLNLRLLDPAGKKRLLEEKFGKWCDEVIALIQETPESMILQREIYDRDMIYSWGIGRVALLGDAAHPLQPNLGQGGCMAIEVCYHLIHLSLACSIMQPACHKSGNKLRFFLSSHVLISHYLGDCMCRTVTNLYMSLFNLPKVTQMFKYRKKLSWH